MTRVSIKLNLALSFAIAFILSFAAQILWGLIVGLFQVDYHDIRDYSDIKLQSNVHLDTQIADYVKKKVKILCWIETCPKYLRQKAIHIQRTWGKRCDKTLYVTTQAHNDTDKELDLVVVNVTEGYKYLWSKTIHALQFIHDRYIDEYDWFFKADDDTYVIIENLRFLLLHQSPEKYLAYGCHLNNPDHNVTFNSGGAGYVLSHTVLRKLRKDGFPNSKICPVQDPTLPEDVAIGICFKNLGVHLGETRDNRGRMRFHIERPEFHLTTGKHPNFWFDKAYPHYYEQGFECCSDEPVSFHYVSPSKMYLYDALLYNVWPYGMKYKEIQVKKR